MSLFHRIARRAGLLLVMGLAFGVADATLQAAAPGRLSHGLLFVPAMADDGGDGGGGSSGGGGASAGGRGGGGGGVVTRPRYGQPTIFDVFRGERRRRSVRPRRAARPQARPTPAVELIASDVAESDIARIRDAGFAILGERRLALLPAVTLRLRAPAALSDRAARARLGRIAPGAVVERNALYRISVDGRPCPDGTCFPYKAADWRGRSCVARGPIGLVDTGVDAGHPALAGAKVETEITRSGGRAASSPEHGTEIGILLVGGPDDGRTTDSASAVGGATLVAVDAFHKVGASDAADAFDLVAALDLLSARGVSIVNLSLAGPANAVLDAAGRRAEENGMIVVAAAGNDGPKAGPRYPAAYPWAIAVTALDARRRVYARAGRGAHVAFAAPGVRLQLPDRSLAPGPQRSGTSYAAALVTAALASQPDLAGAEALKTLAAGAVDLGAPGRDPVFGWGAVGLGAACAPVAEPATAEREPLAD